MSSTGGAPSAKGTTRGTTPGQQTALTGYLRFNKIPDFGQNNPNNCFDLEEQISSVVLPVVEIAKGKKAAIAKPVFIIDPCQIGNVPLKTQTLLSSGFGTQSTGSTDSINGGTGAAVYTGKLIKDFNQTNANKWTTQYREDYQIVEIKATSAANAQQVFLFDTRNLANILAIHSDSTGGTSNLLVEVSINSTNFLQVDSIATAAVTDLQYTLATNALNGAAQAGTVAGTGASTVKLNPLAFRYIRVTIGAAGVGITNTTTISMK